MSEEGASLIASELKAGTYSMLVSYAGTSNVKGSTSTKVTLKVLP